MRHISRSDLRLQLAAGLVPGSAVECPGRDVSPAADRAALYIIMAYDDRLMHAMRALRPCLARISPRPNQAEICRFLQARDPGVAVSCTVFFTLLLAAGQIGLDVIVRGADFATAHELPT
jgi:hypothetical protein